MKKITLFIVFQLYVLVFMAQTMSKYIVVDQFGYRTNDKKTAVIRNPETGFDASESFAPGTSYSVVNTKTAQSVFSAAPTIWNSGATDSTSGDKAWWFDFSSVTESGDFYVLDIQNNVKSASFSIKQDVYDDVLKQAVRTFYYQRAGYEKKLPFAEAGWVDAASHIGNLQDKNCRPYNDKTNASKEKDLSGGWYDAGDFNKYTIWTANYVYEMLQAYEENPNAWSDDYNLPQSGNKIPDLIDEAKWGMNHLLRLQNTDGSVISIVDLDHASPPSAAKGQSVYGGVNTSSTWATAAAYAYGAKVFRKVGLIDFADTLQKAALLSYTWAEANPAVVWQNNDAASGTSGIGAGQQEVSDYGRLGFRLRACAHMFENTAEAKYKTYFESNYTQIHLIQWTYAYPYEMREQETLLYYSALSGITSTVKTAIISKYASSITNSDDNLKAINIKRDPYKAHIGSYTWGSNATKSNQGNLFLDAVKYNTNSTKTPDLTNAGLDFIHYIHGVNPLNMCYLTNMNTKGADNSANQLYHTWFVDKSSKWDQVGVSTYGPAPGFLTGGPNPSYDRDKCCATSSCGTSNSVCNSISITPPKGQPRQKSYLDFNTNWPLNSWEVTENSNGYQIAYIRLLSKFVDRSSVINGGVSVSKDESIRKMLIYPNPTSGSINIDLPANFEAITYAVLSLEGKSLMQGEYKEDFLSLDKLKAGSYLLEVSSTTEKLVEKVVLR